MICDVYSVSATLKKKAVLKSVSFKVSKPQLIGLIGSNGAGKSTLMKAIAGLLPFQGAIKLDGKNISNCKSDRLAKYLAYLPQERTVHWPLVCEEVAMLGRMPYQSGFGRASQKDRDIVSHAMEKMQVSSFSKRPFNQLSGGEQARILIARLLAQEPHLIIADEPTNGLDPAHQISLMQTFKSFVQEGRTVITSLHDLSLASRWCDRILILQDGHLVADGSVIDVMTEEQIQSVYDVSSVQLSAAGHSIIIPTDLASSFNKKGQNHAKYIA